MIIFTCQNHKYVLQPFNNQLTYVVTDDDIYVEHGDAGRNWWWVRVVCCGNSCYRLYNDVLIKRIFLRHPTFFNEIK